jgi:cytoskeletal protein CcmA (bactofilin family)
MFGRSATKLETVIGADSTIQGELSIQGTVRVDGNVEGDIRADCVIVGETGKVRGNVKARTLVVGGRVDGNIAAAEAVELRGRAQVFGEICTARLSVSEGALFEGQSCMKKMKETTEGKEGKIQSLAASRTAS